MDSGNNLIKVPLDSVKLQQIIEDSVGERERERERETGSSEAGRALKQRSLSLPASPSSLSPQPVTGLERREIIQGTQPGWLRTLARAAEDEL